MLYIILAVLFLLGNLFAFALCRASARGDAKTQQAFREYCKNDDTNYKYKLYV